MSIRLNDLVERLGGHVIGNGALEVSGVAPLDQAGPSQLAFLANPRLRAQAAQSAAAALALSPAGNEALDENFRGVRIVVDNPYAWYARAAQHFASLKAHPAPAGIHPAAVVDPTARIAADASIGAHAVIEAEAEIGAGAVVGAGCFIGRGAKIGAGTLLHSRVTFYAGCAIGARGIVHSGAVIGADGFGFANDGGAWVKIPQTGRVLIGDDVEIGANTTIDRGAMADTVIGNGVKLDNQIQIGHNCQIGDHTLMSGCTGVAGSATIGKHCTFGGAAMILGHLEIADGVTISSGSFVSRSIREAGFYTGIYPLSKNADWEKSAAIVRNLPAMREKIRELEKVIKSLTEKSE